MRRSFKQWLIDDLLAMAEALYAIVVAFVVLPLVAFTIGFTIWWLAGQLR